MNSESVYSRPDWTMLGFRLGGEYIVIASDDMTEAELRYETEGLDLMGDAGLLGRSIYEIYELEARMRTITLVRGNSYGECLRVLLRSWRPVPKERPALEGMPAIEGETS